MIALVAVLAGGTAVALGATSTTSRPSLHRGRRGGGAVAVAARYLGIPRAQLRRDLASGETLAQVAAATPGHSEAGVVAALEAAGQKRLKAAGAKLPARIQKLVHAKLHGSGASPARLRAVALSYLGIGRKALTSELRSGHSLAQVADATPGKSAKGLQEALLAAVSQRLQARLSSGAITKSTEERRLATAQRRIAAVLQRTGRARAASRRSR